MLKKKKKEEERAAVLGSSQHLAKNKEGRKDFCGNSMIEHQA